MNSIISNISLFLLTLFAANSAFALQGNLYTYAPLTISISGTSRFILPDGSTCGANINYPCSLPANTHITIDYLEKFGAMYIWDNPGRSISWSILNDGDLATGEIKLFATNWLDYPQHLNVPKNGNMIF